MALGFNQDAEKRFFQNLLNLGYSPASAAGNMGNVMAESGFNPNAFNSEGGGKGAWGGYQWRADRQDFAKQYMKDQGLDPGDIWSHGLTAHHEAMNRPGDAKIDMKKFMSLDDPSEAAVMWRRDFERPGADPAGYERAVRYAQEVYNKYSGLEPVKERAGYKFAEDADNRARGLQDLYAKNSELDPFRTSMIMRSLMPGNFEEATKQLDMGTGQLAGQRSSLDMGTPTGQQPRDPRSGAASRAAANTGTPAPVPSPTSPNKVSTNDEAAPAEKPKLLDRIFKTREGEEAGTPVTRRESFKDALNALSIGLGQMSHGQPVDVVSPIARIQESRANRRLTAERHQQDQLHRDRQYAIDAKRLALTERELATKEGAIMSPEQVAKHASQFEGLAAKVPALQPVYNMATEGNRSALDQLVKTAGALAGKNATNTNPSLSPVGKSVVDALKAGDTETAMEGMKNLSKDELDLVNTINSITSEALGEGKELSPAARAAMDAIDNGADLNAAVAGLPASERKAVTDLAQSAADYGLKLAQIADLEDRPLSEDARKIMPAIMDPGIAPEVKAALLASLPQDEAARLESMAANAQKARESYDPLNAGLDSLIRSVPDTPYTQNLFRTAQQPGALGQAAYEELRGLSKATADQAVLDRPLSAEASTLIDQVNNGSLSIDEARERAESGLHSANERERVTNTLNSIEAARKAQDTSVTKLADRIRSAEERGDMDEVKRLKEAAKILSPTGDVATAAQKQYNQTLLNQRTVASNASAEALNSIQSIVNDTIKTTVEMHRNGGQGGIISKWVGDGARLLDQLGDGNAAEYLEENFGVNIVGLEGMDRNATELAFGFLKSLGMTGAGLSEGERQAAISIQPNELMTNEGRMKVLTRMQVRRAIANGKADLYHEATPDTVKDVDKMIATDLSVYAGEVTRAMQAKAAASLIGSDYTKSDGGAGTRSTREAQAVILVNDIAQTIAAAGPEGVTDTAARVIYARLDAAGFTPRDLNSTLDSMIPRVPLEVAKLLDDSLPALNEIITPEGERYIRGEGGSWSVAPDVGSLLPPRPKREFSAPDELNKFQKMLQGVEKRTRTLVDDVALFRDLVVGNPTIYPSLAASYVSSQRLLKATDQIPEEETPDLIGP